METLKLTKYMADWWYMTARIGVQARANPDIISCACSDYLMFRWEGRLLKRRGVCRLGLRAHAALLSDSSCAAAT